MLNTIVLSADILSGFKKVLCRVSSVAIQSIFILGVIVLNALSVIMIH